MTLCRAVGHVSKKFNKKSINIFPSIKAPSGGYSLERLLNNLKIRRDMLVILLGRKFHSN